MTTYCWLIFTGILTIIADLLFATSQKLDGTDIHLGVAGICPTFPHWVTCIGLSQLLRNCHNIVMSYMEFSHYHSTRASVTMLWTAYSNEN